jgi:hypothetical protein
VAHLQQQRLTKIASEAAASAKVALCYTCT